MIWPASLVSTALLNTLHSMSGGGGSTTGGMSRDRVRLSQSSLLVSCSLIPTLLGQFFFRVTLAMFLWSWMSVLLSGSTAKARCHAADTAAPCSTVQPLVPLHSPEHVRLRHLDRSDQCRHQSSLWMYVHAQC